jgi:hypothetical protein
MYRRGVGVKGTWIRRMPSHLYPPLSCEADIMSSYEATQDAEALIQQAQAGHIDQHLLSAVMNLYLKCGMPERALKCFFAETEKDRSLIAPVTATTALTACADIGNEDALIEGERILVMVRMNISNSYYLVHL